MNSLGVEDVDMLDAQSRLSESISSLPVEIFQMIFMHTVEDAFDHQSTQYAVQTALNLSHVCAFWRAAALEFPNMWFPVYFKPERRGTRALADLFLKRGMSTPIRLSNIRTVKHRMPLMPTDFRSHVPRLQEIALYLVPWDAKALFREMGTRFPSLIHLEVSYDLDAERLGVEGEPEDTHKPIEIEAPNVRHLELESMKLTSLSSFTDLTYLSLSSVRGSINANDLVELLVRSPRLQFIQLLDRVNSTGPPPARNETLYLPDLHHLFLCCLVEDLVPFCQLLIPSVGKNTELYIQEDYGLEYEELCTIASNSLWMFQQPHELACQLFDEPSSSKTALFDTIPKSKASIKLSLRWCGSFETVIKCPYLDPSKVTTLSIKTGLIKYHELLPKFPNLKRLAIHDETNDFHEVRKAAEGFLSAIPRLEVLRMAMPKLRRFISSKWVAGVKVSLLRKPRSEPLTAAVILYPSESADPEVASNAFTEGWVVKRYDVSKWEDWETIHDI